MAAVSSATEHLKEFAMLSEKVSIVKANFFHCSTPWRKECLARLLGLFDCCLVG